MKIHIIKKIRDSVVTIEEVAKEKGHQPIAIFNRMISRLNEFERLYLKSKINEE